MELTDKIIIERPFSGPVGSHHKKIRIEDANVMDLIKELNEEGVEINPRDSEEIRAYEMLGTGREVTVPLGTEFPGKTILKGYLLRAGGRATLNLRNYDNITAKPLRGVIGGTVSGTAGIVCSVSLRGDMAEREYFEKIREAVREIYDPLRLPGLSGLTTL